MDPFRQSVKDAVVSANRGPFGGWWEALLEIDPELLRRVHEHLKVAEESGPIPERLRHLIWTAVDAVVTHLYPRGLGVHARIAVEEGASLRQVVESLEIAAIVSSRGYGIGLPIVLEEIAAFGGQPVATELCERGRAVRTKFEQDIGTWPEWMETALRFAPDALEALLDLGYGRRDEAGLDPKSRELIFLAANSCPAIVEREAIRLHARRALELGATSEEIVQALRLANGIGLHPISEGIVQLKAHNLG